jgi:hypothetical protein
MKMFDKVSVVPATRTGGKEPRRPSNKYKNRTGHNAEHGQQVSH